MRLRLDGEREVRGIVGWSLRDLATTELDGLPTSVSASASAAGRPGPIYAGTAAAGRPQPNGVTAVDHVVAFTPDLDRTAAALSDAGLDFRRLREEPTPGGAPRQAFFRVGEAVLEVVEAPEGTAIAADPDGPARLWGISFAVADLDATVAFLGDLAGTPRDAVQPGRRIVTLRREAGLGPAIAFMSPR